MLRSALLVAGTLAALALAIRFLLPRALPWFVYHPAPLDEAEADPAIWGLPEAGTTWIEAADGTRLHAWWVPAEAPRRGAALYLHGNAGHLAIRAPAARRLAGLGLDVLLLDYRGYGMSEGSPSEEGLYADAEAAWRHLVEARGVEPGRLVVYGGSLGGAVAVELATRVPVAGLVLAAPLAGTLHIAKEQYPFLAPLLAWDREAYDAVAAIRRVEAPVLVVHGTEDRVVPLELGRAVHDAAGGPARWHAATGRGHNDLHQDEGAWRAIDGFLDDVLGPRP